MCFSSLVRRSLVSLFSHLLCLLVASAATGQDLMHTTIESDRVTFSNGEFVPRFANFLPQSKIVGPGEVWVVPADSTWDAIEVQSGGKLVFDQTRDTVLWVTHLMNLPGGEIEMIVPCGRRAEIVIRNVPIDTGRDPFQWGNGLLNLGKMTRVGCATSPWIPANGDLRAGDTAIQLKQPPAGWRVGDELIVPDTASPKYPAPQPRRESPLTVAGVNGATVLLSKPLDFDHLAIRDPDGEVHLTADVANFSRNLVIRSENADGTPGHTATIGHEASWNVQYNEFRGLGRTNAVSLDTTSPRPVPLEKQIGRYADHQHHTQGFNSLSRGNSYRGHPRTKWGLALHRTSDARVEWNVCADFVGSCYVTEEGDEVRNTIVDNFAAYITGGAANFRSPLANLGSGVNCPGCEGAAIWVDGLVGSTIDRNHLWNSNFGGMLIPAVKPGALAPSQPGGPLNTPLGFPELLPASVTDNVFAGNVLSGLEYWGIGKMFPVTRAILANNTVTQVNAEVTVPNVRLVDSIVLCDTTGSVGLKIGKPYVADFRFEGGMIRGCGIGIDSGGGNQHTLVTNALLQNRIDIAIPELSVTDGEFNIVNTTHKPMPGLDFRPVDYVLMTPWTPGTPNTPAELASCRHRIVNWNGTGQSYCLSAPRLRPAQDPFNGARSENGAKAFASSEHSWGEPFYARGANDGDRLGTDWAFGPTYYWGGVWAADAGPPQWLAVDFGTQRTIDKVTLFFTQDSYKAPAVPTAEMACTLFCPQDFTVQVWSGGAWQTVPGGAITGNNRVIREVTFAPFATSQVRVLITKGGTRMPISLVELEARSTAPITPPVPDPTIPRVEDGFGHIFTLVDGAVLRNGRATTIPGVGLNLAACEGAVFFTPDNVTWQKYQGPGQPRWKAEPFTCPPPPPPGTPQPPQPPQSTAPAITAHPAPQTINAGQQAQLSVTATGTAPLSYQWYVGASGNTTLPISGAVAPAFTTAALNATTDYWVRVSNTAGSVNSATATVTVVTSQPPQNPGGPTDGEGAVWTFGPQQETLRNGIQAGGGLGLEYRICNGVVYVLGTNFIWHQYTGSANGGWIPFVNPTCSSDTSPPQPPADSDGDGVPDAIDQCPTQAGSGSNGCPLPPNPPSDRDGDGVADATDQCPNDPGPAPSGCPPPPSTPDGPVDAENAVWTFGPQAQTLRNGVHAGGGFGFEFRICGGVATVLGTNWIWHQYTGGPNGGWTPLFSGPACGP